jgi:hypothetical protein
MSKALSSKITLNTESPSAMHVQMKQSQPMRQTISYVREEIFFQVRREAKVRSTKVGKLS